MPDSLLNKIAEICQSKEFLRTPILKNIYKTAVSVSNKFKKLTVTKGWLSPKGVYLLTTDIEVDWKMIHEYCGTDANHK